MGAVLAMRRVLSAAALLLALGACGNGAAPPLTQIGGALVTQIFNSDDAPDVRAQLTPQVLANLQQPLLLVELPARKASATMARFAVTDGRTDWRSGDGSAVVMVDDVLIATRGLGADLFLAEVGDLRAALIRGSGTISRRHHLLDGENQEYTQSYTCTITDAGLETINLLTGNIVSRRSIETCVSESPKNMQFMNEYWSVPGSVEILQSYQWVSTEVGYMILKYINP